MSTASSTLREPGAGMAALGVSLIVLLVVAAVVRGWLAGADPIAVQLDDRLLAPGTSGHWLGTDHLGRDLWSRVLAGFAWSLSVAGAATLLASGIGISLGVLAASRGGVARAAVSWGVDSILALPGIVVAICVVTVLGQGWLPLVLTLGLLSWPVFARVAEAETRTLLTYDYIAAARLLGQPAWRIASGHLLPGLRASMGAIAAFHFAEMIVAESALSFLGIGSPVGEPTWGNMLAESRQYVLRAPWMLLVPAVSIIVAVVAVNLLGDGLAARQRARGGAA